jgi:hypothetical protein
MKGSVVALIFCLALFGAVLVPNASANSGNEEMILTIKKAPVELPGHVLVPGKYDLKFTNLEHNEVVVRTADGSQPVGFFMVIPVTRNLEGFDCAPGRILLSGSQNRVRVHLCTSTGDRASGHPPFLSRRGTAW